MKKILFTLSILLLLTGIANAQYSVDEAAQIFGTEPEVTNIRLSPDGSKILMLQMYEGKKILVTKSLVDPDTRPNGIPLEGGNFLWAGWATNERIVAGITHDSYRRWVRVYSLHDSLISLDWTGEDQVNLAYEKSRSFFYDLGQGNVVDWLRNEPDHVLTYILDDLYKLNIRTNEYEKYLDKTLKTDGAIHTDRNGVARYMTGRVKNSGDRHDDKYRKTENSPWQVVFNEEQSLEQNPTWFEGLTSDDNIIFVSKYDDNGKYGLFTYDVDNQSFIEQIVKNETYDTFNFKISDEGELVSYQYFDGRTKTIYLGDIEQRIEKIISTNIPNVEFRLVSRSDDSGKVIIYTTSPNDPGSYYLLDLNRNALELVDYIYKKTDPSTLKDVEIIDYNAIDGVKIQGFLTLPQKDNQTNLPTIIFPNEGQKTHVSWGFDFMAQFFVSQGYAVLRMNPRGASGYGKEFEDIAKEEWGNKAIQDINDGAKWMIDNGYSDPDKICVYGSGIGGYAALQAVARDSSLYKCVATYSPLTDLFPYYNGISHWIGNRNYSFGAVNWYTKDEFRNFRKKDHWSFDDVSPDHNVDNINAPALVLYGPNWRDIGYGHATDFVKKMRNEDKEITLVNLYNDERFYYSTAPIEIKDLKEQILNNLGEFLAKHLQ